MKLSKQRMSYIFLALIFISSFSLKIYSALTKNIFHGDETCSFSLSNSNDPFLEKNGIWEGRWLKKQELIEYLAPTEKTKFNYSQVYLNQQNDAHPPLYYYILHTVSSLFPSQFNIWLGYGLNFLFSIIGFIFFYKLSFLFLNKQLSRYTALIVWSISGAAVGFTVFVRMYELLTTISLISLYFSFKYFETNKNKFLLFLIVSNYLAFMTHYYYFVFYFWICFFLLLFKKKNKSLLFYFSSVATSLVMLQVSFSPWIYHLTISHRGSESIGTIKSLSFDHIYSRFFYYSEKMTSGILGNYFTNYTTIIIIMALVLLVISFIPLKKHTNALVILISSIVFYVIILSISPYIELRYVYIIIPSFIILVCFLIENIPLKKASTTLSTCLIMLSCAQWFFKTQYRPYFIRDLAVSKINLEDHKPVAILMYDAWRSRGLILSFFMKDLIVGRNISQIKIEKPSYFLNFETGNSEIPEYRSGLKATELTSGKDLQTYLIDFE
jgi:hypothetical protein